jgi:tetratricopeptide (TPR) repeat protein
VAIDFWAFDEYLKGRTLYRQRKDLPEAIAHLQAAVDRAPEFGEAWATLSLAHESARFNTTLEQRAVLGNALSNMLTAAEHALALDPDAALTLHAQGNVRRGEARYAEAEQLYLRAMEADSTYPDVREDYAELLNHVGRHEDALVAARALVELEPFVANFWRRIADVGVSLDRRTLVEEAQDRMREIDPSAPSGVLADFYFEFWQGRIEPAREALAEAKRFSPTAAAPAVELFQWSERNASIDDSHARRLIVGGPTHYAPFAAHRGDADVYFAAFEDPLTHFSYYFRYALPVTAPLLGDPRGEEMLRRYGFVAYWREKGWPAYCRPLDDDDFECGPAVKELRMTE